MMSCHVMSCQLQLHSYICLYVCLSYASAPSLLLWKGSDGRGPSPNELYPMEGGTMILRREPTRIVCMASSSPRMRRPLPNGWVDGWMGE